MYLPFKIRLIALSFMTCLSMGANTSYAFDIRTIFGESTYKVFSCKNDSTQKTPAECEREFKGTAVFKVIKEKSQVFVSYTLAKDGKKVLIELESCKVIDEKNWICGGKETTRNEAGTSSYMREPKYQMIDGQVDVSDLYSRFSIPGYPTEISYSKSLKFVKN